MPKLIVEAYIPPLWKRVETLAPTRTASLQLAEVLPDSQYIYDLECTDTCGNFALVKKTAKLNNQATLTITKIFPQQPFYFFTRNEGEYLPTLMRATHYRRIRG